MRQTRSALPRTLPVVLLLALSLGACDGGSVPVDLEDHRFGDPTEVDPGTDPFRERRRMDIDQLNASMRRVSGGRGWVIGSTDQLVRYSETLGVPDFLNSSSEDLTASLLFLKFLDDASRYICDDWLDAERSSAEGRLFFVHVDPADEAPAQGDIDRNLAYLLLRFHGRAVAAESEELRPWRELLSEAQSGLLAAQEGEPDPAEAWAEAWGGVCVALYTHPDFFTY